MEQAEPVSVLQRKIDGSRASGTPGPRSFLRALRLGFARGALSELGLQLAVIGITHGHSSAADLGARLNDDSLLLMLDGPAGVSGLAVLDSGAVTALVRFQVMGVVTEGEISTRTCTDTDAALVAPFLEAGLAQTVALCDDGSPLAELAGLRFGARAKSARAVMPAFDAEDFRLFELTFEFGNGASQGGMLLALPELVDNQQDANDTSATGEACLDGLSGVMRADLDGVLCRLHVPLSAFSGLQPGDILPVKREGLQETRLVSVAGQTVAVGRLGQVNGLRAVRINETQPVDPVTMSEELEFVAPPVDASEPAGDVSYTTVSDIPDVPDDLQQPPDAAEVDPAEANADPYSDSDSLPTQPL